MKTRPPPVYDNLEELAGLAFAHSRDVVTAIRADLLPHLPSGDRSDPLLLLKLLDERRVFERQVLVEDESMVAPAIWRGKTLPRRRMR